jgi:hypothetical protein
MNRLIEVQDIVGPFHLWPAYILESLFCESLTPVTRLTLSAFLYDNGVGLYYILPKSDNKHGKYRYK